MKLNENEIKRKKEERPAVLILQAVTVVQFFSTKKHGSFEQEGVTFNSLLFKMNLHSNNTLKSCL